MPNWILRTAIGVAAACAGTAHAAEPWLVGMSGVAGRGAVDVLIIGTGIDLDHPTLVGADIDGYDFVAGDADPDSDDVEVVDGPSHGSTALAAIVRAVAPGASVHVYDVFDGDVVSEAALKQALVRAKSDAYPIVIVGIPSFSGDVEVELEQLETSGALVIAPAGDAGRATFGLGALNRWANVLTVAATAPPGVPTVTLDVQAPATVAGSFGLAPLTPVVPVAGTLDVWGCDTTTSEAPIALVTDSDCLVTIAPRAAAAGVEALLVAAPPGLVEVFDATVTGLPVLAVDHALAARIAASRAAGTPVSVAIGDALATDSRLIDTVAFISSRGPWRDAIGLRAEPELSAPGQHMLLPLAGGALAEQSGTALAAAYVGGVAALLKEAHPSWKGLELRARLVNATAKAYAAPRPLAGGNPSTGGAGGPSPLTIGGAGRVDAQRALRGGVVVYTEDEGRPLLDFGLMEVADYGTRGRRIIIHNGSDTRVDVSFEAVFRDASDDQGGVTIDVPAPLSIEPGQSGFAVVGVSIDPTKLRDPASRPSSSRLGSYDPVAAWTADEVDGVVRVTVSGDEAPIALPFWVVPRAAANTTRSGDTCLAPEAFELGLANTVASSQSELFTLVGPDLGARTILDNDEDLFQVAVVGDGAVAVTVDADGVAPYDHVILAAPESVFTGGLATGRELSVVLEPATEELPDSPDTITLPFGRYVMRERRLVITEPLAGARILSASVATLGLGQTVQLAVTPFPASVLSTTFLTYDASCAYPLVHASLKVRGAAPLQLASTPTCADPKGLLALHFGNAAATVVERIVPPTAAVYTCDPQIADIADPDTCTATTDYRAYVHGTCATVATVAPVDSAPLGLGTHAVTLSITDPWGNTATCATSLEVSDGAPPVVDCGDIAEGFAAGALPLDYTAVATDACGGVATVEVVGYRCLVFENGEITYQLDDGCGAALDGTTMRVVSVGAPSNLFEWSVLATDAVGNEVVERCYAAVGRTDIGAHGGGGTGCNGGAVWSLWGLLILVTRRRT